MLLFFAAISYNLYLYHQAIARELLAWHIPPYRGSDPHGDAHWEVTYTIVAFVVTIAQAAIVTYAFERPLLRVPADAWRRLVSRKREARALTGM
jgi:peptidoglycan/LPS O-acetylase OafA/YrhL